MNSTRYVYPLISKHFSEVRVDTKTSRAVILSIALILIPFARITLSQPVKIKLVTAWNTPLSDERIEVVVPRENGNVLIFDTTLDEEGTFTIYAEEGMERIRIKLIDYGIEREINITQPIISPLIVKIHEIGGLKVCIVGSRGQALPGLPVTVSGPMTVSKLTDNWGCATFLLVPGEYEVTVNLGKEVHNQKVSVTSDILKEYKLNTNIFLMIGGWTLSFEELVSLTLLIVVQVIVLFIIAHEYTIWRRRRIVRAIVPQRVEISTLEYAPSEAILSPQAEEEFMRQAATGLVNYYESKSAHILAKIYNDSIGLNELQRTLLTTRDPDKFENAVRDLLTIFGFMTLRIGHSNKPGESDVIALSPAQNIALIIECKCKPKGEIKIKEIRQVSVDKYLILHENFQKTMNVLISNAKSLHPHTQEFVKGLSIPLYIVLRNHLREILNMVRKGIYSRRLLIEYLERECRYGPRKS